MKKIIGFILIFVLIGSVLIFMNSNSQAAGTYPGFKVSGRFLYDKEGEKTVLCGVSKMIIWTDIGGTSYPEIAKTGANCVRIVWTTTGTDVQLDKAIYNCRANHMIPMIELHDATGEWSKLSMCVDYWVKPEIVAVLQRHQEYLLVNIANECGQTVADADFRSGYETAIKRMRAAGIHVPLIIDAPSYGQNINSLQANGPYLTSVDPDQNLMFSVHMWWPYMWGHTDQEVIDEINESVQMGLPLIVGEFGGMWDTTEQGKIPYQTIIKQCTLNQVGWLAWEWGPGNNPQTFLDMTKDSTYATLYDWGLDVAVTNQYSIKNTAVRPASIQGPPPATPTPVPTPPGNIAMNKTVTVSSTDGTNPGQYAVDGNMDTRWASVSGSDPQWISVDLGKTYDINRIILYWEAAYATQYRLQVSNDATNWTDIYTQYNGTGRTTDITVSGSGRYVRMYGTQRINSSWGYSLYEIAIYSGGTIVTPTPVITVTPTPVKTVTPTMTPVRTATPRRTATPNRTATPRRTATPGRTATPRITPTPVVIATPTPVITATPLVTATPSSTETPSPTATPFSTGNIKVQFYNQSTAATSNQIYLNIQLVNTGTGAVALSDIKIRYYYTVDGNQSQTFYCDYSPVGSSNVTGSFVTMAAAKTGADTYVEVGFSSSAGSLAAGGNTIIQARFAKNDWSNYTQSNDYSFNSTGTTYADWTKVTGYISGSLQWGTEP